MGWGACKGDWSLFKSVNTNDFTLGPEFKSAIRLYVMENIILPVLSDVVKLTLKARSKVVFHL